MGSVVVFWFLLLPEDILFADCDGLTKKKVSGDEEDADAQVAEILARMV